MTLFVSSKKLDTSIGTRSESLLVGYAFEPTSFVASFDKAAGHIKKTSQKLKGRQRDRDLLRFPSSLDAKSNEQPRRPVTPPGSDHGAP
ncbi:MAG TPA: hypothetical protein VGG12_09590 [Methylovirgula sp.]|jgi:hypothetical protein